ncbi:MAG: hypothetical protein PHR60_02465 [Eubacteriales bacterium]|nr:hypothetical protein [Eubacteriales bacterium]
MYIAILLNAVTISIIMNKHNTTVSIFSIFSLLYIVKIIETAKQRHDIKRRFANSLSRQNKAISAGTQHT